MIDSGLYHSSISAARDRGASNAIEIPTLLPQLEAGCFEALVKKLMGPLFPRVDKVAQPRSLLMKCGLNPEHFMIKSDREPGLDAAVVTLFG